jgi:transposase
MYGATHRGEPTVPKPNSTERGRIHLGLDVAKNSIAVAILRPGEVEPDTEKIAHDEPSIRRLIARLGDPRGLCACYEAGPTGYDLHRLLTSFGVRTDVVAPSLIPRSPGDRVKTDRRDSRRLARLHRAGELTAIRVPTVAEEGIRDLCRARQVVVEDRRRARQRLGSFLLRHNEIYREQTAWTAKHEAWIAHRDFADQATKSAFSFYRAAVAERDVTLSAITAELAPYFDRAPFADPVHRLAAYRGIDYLGALTIVSEVCDFRRFAHSGAFMGFCGLVPSEYSTGESVARGHITHAGNVHVRTQLIESAWAYQHGPARGIVMARRQGGLPPETIDRAWRAQIRLCGRFRRLSVRKDSHTTVVAAIARELAGFVYVEMTA